MSRFVEILENRCLMSVAALTVTTARDDSAPAIHQKVKKPAPAIPNMLGTYRGQYGGVPFYFTFTSQSSKGKLAGTITGLVVNAVPGSASAVTPFTGTINNKGQFTGKASGSLQGVTKVTFTYNLTASVSSDGSTVSNGKIKMSVKIYGHGGTSTVPFTAVKQ